MDPIQRIYLRGRDDASNGLHKLSASRIVSEFWVLLLDFSPERGHGGLKDDLSVFERGSHQRYREEIPKFCRGTNQFQFRT